MRTALVLAALVLSSSVIPAAADDPKTAGPTTPSPKAVSPTTGEAKKDYADLSRLIHKIVVKNLPREFEERSGWGNMVPLTVPLRFPNLPRARVRTGDKVGYPDGVWKKFRARIVDPAKDLKINVRDLAKAGPKTFRLVLGSQVALAGEGEIQNWQKGLPLGRVIGQADAVVDLGMVFDVGVTLNAKKFPPDLVIEPKLADLKIDLEQFSLRRVFNPTTNLGIEGELAKNIGNDFKDVLRSLLKGAEPEIKSRANEAIAQALKEGKGNISAAALFKLGSLGN